MTKITLDRSTVEQTIEALEYYYELSVEGVFSKSITALRAALTEEALQRMTDVQQEMERNFCPRCGKRATGIHTCTPPDSKHATIAEWRADNQRKPPATIDEIFDRMNKAPKGVFYGHDPMTIWMEAWRAAEQHGIKDA